MNIASFTCSNPGPLKLHFQQPVKELTVRPKHLQIAVNGQGRDWTLALPGLCKPLDRKIGDRNMGTSLILFLSSMFLSHSLFADVTVPYYTVPKDGRVSLALYDQDGRMVRPLRTGKPPAAGPTHPLPRHLAAHQLLPDSGDGSRIQPEQLGHAPIAAMTPFQAFQPGGESALLFNQRHKALKVDARESDCFAQRLQMGHETHMTLAVREVARTNWGAAARLRRRVERVRPSADS